MMPRGLRRIVFLALAIGAPSPFDARAQAPTPDPSPDVVIAFLYNTSDPAGTFRTKVYDVRKGQYDAARMAEWARSTAAGHPGTRAYLRGVRLADEPGATEAEKVAGAIERERRSVSNSPPPGEPPRRREAGAAIGRPGAGAVVPLAGTRWSFTGRGPAVYEFLPGGKLRHFTSSREASGEWEQRGEEFTLWVGASREAADFTFRGRARGRRLVGVVRSRLFPDAPEAAVRALWSPDTEASLDRVRGDR